jgi:ElaB/YqjD/DUF883 family membrane-anchored ribosome-binding protein
MYNNPSKDVSLSDVKNSASNLAQETVTDISAVANKAGRKVRSLYNAASEEISSDIDVVTTQIRKNPVQSSLIALGAGFLLGALLRR